jgi:hypothetical protein
VARDLADGRLDKAWLKPERWTKTFNPRFGARRSVVQVTREAVGGDYQ